jgi:hypothetical protein
MKKAELAAKTVAELKALAKKKKVSLPAGAKKDDVIKALMASGTRPKAEKPAGKKKAAAEKAAESKKAAAPKKAEAPKRPARRAAVSAPVVKTVKEPAKAPARRWEMPVGAEEPLMAQERVAEAKFYTGPVPEQRPTPPTRPYEELPFGYGEEKIALMARDPYVAFAYWEATPSRIDREKAWFGWNSKLCVRIYDVTGVQFDGRNALGYYDQEIYERIGNWYFDLGRPTHSFCADLGLLSPEGKFLTLARSNYVTMPRDGASDVIDEEWMIVDEEFWKLYGYPEGVPGGISSQQAQEIIQRRRRMHEISSPGMSSREKAKRK